MNRVPCLPPSALGAALVVALASGTRAQEQAPADPAQRAFEDGDLATLAAALAAHREARATGSGVDGALEAVDAERMELSKALGGRDFLGRTADLERAVRLSFDRDGFRRERGKVQTDEHDGGTFAAEPLAYSWRLPDDYDPVRVWPLILSVPDQDETPAAHLRAHWTHRPLLEGAIVLVPAMPTEKAEWDKVMVEGRPGGLAHLLTAQRLASERFAVDPDRVFVVGRGKGVAAAVAAGDYAPHRFAGIVGRAGEPGELGPENFTNLPTLFVGGGAVARDFQAAAHELRFDHCEVTAELDGEGLWRWLGAHPRDSYPRTVSLVVGQPFPTRAHWIRVAPTAMDTRATATVDRERNRIEVTCNGTSSVALFLSDELVDLDRQLEVVCNGEGSLVRLRRSLPEALGLLEEGVSDPGSLYVAQHVVELNRPEALDAVALEALELGVHGEPGSAERRRLEAGWVRQDLHWIPPDEVEELEAGRFWVDGEWLELEGANRRRGSIASMWRIPSRRLLVHSTAPRPVALRAMAEMQSALDDLRRVFGAEPSYPLSVAVMRDEEQYDRLAFGDPDGRRSPTHVARLHIVHSAFLAESWFEPVERKFEHRGMGVCYWDTFAPYGDRYGRHAARLAVGLSYADALDPSPKAVRSAAKEGPPPGFYGAFQEEKTMPAWLRWGGAVYAERFFHDDTVAADGDPWWTRKWSLENLEEKGGFMPLEEVFAFPLDPDDRGQGLRLLIQAGLLVAFMVDGDCGPLKKQHEKLKRTLEKGRLHPRTIRELEEALVEHEAELRAFAGV